MAGRGLSLETRKRLVKMGYRKREKNPHWKGGKYKDKDGYILVRAPHHAMARKTGYVYEHRQKMAESLGRNLHTWETVHHINGVKDDNRIRNLKLLPGNEHNSRIQAIYQENNFLKKQLSRFLKLGMEVDHAN